MQMLRERNRSDRLRAEFPTGRGTGEVLRTGHETREVGLPVVWGSRRPLGALPPRIIEECLASPPNREARDDRVSSASLRRTTAIA
jgi:hypothetical protein